MGLIPPAVDFACLTSDALSHTGHLLHIALRLQRLDNRTTVFSRTVMLPSSAEPFDRLRDRPRGIAELRDRRTTHTLWMCFAVCLFGVSLSFLAEAALRSEEHSAVDARRIQGIVDDLRARLRISQTVTVTIVPRNPLVVSVHRKDDRQAGFQLSFEAGFMDQLGDEGLRAVVAHELGHVWIFTHHPYLQTEQLANKIALRVVTREDLERVYGKVSRRSGNERSLARYLGE